MKKYTKKFQKCILIELQLIEIDFSSYIFVSDLTNFKTDSNHFF